jgi:DNA polymerase-3 subunit delta'
MNMKISIYPWLEKPWQQLQRLAVRQKMPHALLLSGTLGIGKWQLAQHLAHALLCQQPLTPLAACGHCRSCELLAIGNHPDLFAVQADTERGNIKIDQVRSVATFINQTPHTASQQVVLLHPAEAMNLAASNALLKTLEEPSPNSVLILVTHQITSLPATIRSRCQLIRCPAPSDKELQQWLAQTMPEQSASEVQDFIGLTSLSDLSPQTLSTQREHFAKDLQQYFTQEVSSPECVKHMLDKNTALEVVHWLQCWLQACLQQKLLFNVVDNKNGQYLPKSMNLDLSVDDLFAFYDRVLQTKRLFISAHHVNQQLQLEKLLENFYGQPSTQKQFIAGHQG